MADTGWVVCGTGANDASVGTEAWNNPGNITSDDGSYADGSGSAVDEQMYYIKGSNFGLSVPGGATIDGIEIRGQFGDAGGGGSADQSLITHAQVEHPSSGFGTDQETGSTEITYTQTNYDYGGASELHGKTWSASDVNNSSFGVAFSLQAGDNRGVTTNPRCDAIWVKVYYTEVSISPRNKFYIYG